MFYWIIVLRRSWTIRKETKPNLLPAKDGGKQWRVSHRTPTCYKGPCEPEIPMSHFRERLEALRPRNGNRSCSQVDETNPPTRVEHTNLITPLKCEWYDLQKNFSGRLNNRRHYHRSDKDKAHWNHLILRLMFTITKSINWNTSRPKPIIVQLQYHRLNHTMW